jgi:predicted dithiol-disulfide oxidoreductase (DUF899 family)
MEKPEIVSEEQWQAARAELLVAEKELTRALDRQAALRRRLPMVRVTGDYVFDTPEGARSLLELFDGRGQLVTYQFMDNGPGSFCPGCSKFTDNVPEAAVAQLAEAGVSWVTVSNMPLAQIEVFRSRRRWTPRFVSSHGTSFAEDCGADGGFLLSAFLREGDEVFRTYSTTQRGVDRLLFSHNILDLTVYGRQEDWEDSPSGWPQHPTYG